MSNDTQVPTLTEFLLARIVEDEAWAQMAQDASDNSPWTHGSGKLRGDVFTRAGLRVAETRSANTSRHIARHDPARVLAECEAKRRIVAEVESWGTFFIQRAERVLRPIAAVYSDHPDYDEAWRP